MLRLSASVDGLSLLVRAIQCLGYNLVHFVLLHVWPKHRDGKSSFGGCHLSLGSEHSVVSSLKHNYSSLSITGWTIDGVKYSTYLRGVFVSLKVCSCLLSFLLESLLLSRSDWNHATFPGSGCEGDKRKARIVDRSRLLMKQIRLVKMYCTLLHRSFNS